MKRRFLAGVDVEQNALGLAYVVAIEQRRVESVDDGFLHTALAAGTPHGHDGTATAAHGRLHVLEVEVDVALNGYQLRNALGGIAQYLVGTAERLLDRDVRVGIDIADALIVNNKNGINVLAHLLHALQRLHNFPFLLKVERYGDDADGEQPHALSHASHHGRSTRACAATHARRDEHHLCAVGEELLDLFKMALGRLASLLRIASRTKAADGQLHRDGRP